MDPRTEKIRKVFCGLFRGLASDNHFKITSKQDSSYNCIAWAYNMNDKWMWPNTGEYPFLDGVHYWPNDSVMEPSVKNFIEAFRLKGYECCDNGNFEQGFQKIALYAKQGSDECTHAARQLRNGYWTSKMGSGEDIQHGTAFTIEGGPYGEVRCFMKRAFY